MYHNLHAAVTRAAAEGRRMWLLACNAHRLELTPIQRWLGRAEGSDRGRWWSIVRVWTAEVWLQQSMERSPAHCFGGVRDVYVITFIIDHQGAAFE